MGQAFETDWSGVDTAGRISVSLVNTLDWRRRESPTELLVSCEALVRWARTAGVLTRGEARALRAEALEHPRRAARVLRAAIELRETLAELFLAAGEGEALPPSALSRLDRICRDGRAAQRLDPDGGRAAWRWRSETAELERPLWAAALDAADLATTGELARVRQCADRECGWLFLDTSKNQSRRWCSMESCGNRNKARSFYERSARGARRAGSPRDRGT